MPNQIQYALMAAASYISTRPDINRFPVSDGWTEHTENRRVRPSGFEATYFTSGTDLVISFAGTYPGKLLGPTNSLGVPVDFVADLALGVGYSSDQLLQAVQYYLDRKRENSSATITLTGHSLGGGLAALVGVFFGTPAITFDQAPFANAAQDSSFWANPLNLAVPDVATKLKADLLASGYTAAELSPLSNFLATRAIGGGIPNANLVSTTRVDGEFLSDWVPIAMYDIIGTPATSILHGPTSAGGIDLHAQSLLIAFLQSDQTAVSSGNPQQTLSKVTYKLTDLLAMLVDANLYSRSTDTPKENFLERLVRHEFGNASDVMNDVTVGAVAPDAMLTRFTKDLWELAQDGGLTINDGIPIPGYFQAHNLSKALTAFAMQMYYEDTANAINASKELFTDLSTAGTSSNGITFDMHDVSKDVAAAMDSTDPKVKIDLTKARGYQYFQTYIQTAFTPAERTLTNSILPVLRDWYVQAGTEPLNTADTQNRNAFLLGGAGNDGLVGGAGTDLLIGNAGADLLQGKEGNDFLLGGKGEDTYVHTTGDGLDTILDTGDANTLAVDGDVLSGGAEYGDARVHRSADGKHRYVENAGQMLIDGKLIIQNYATGGSFGLTMTGAPTLTNPEATRDILGDPQIHSDTIAPGTEALNWKITNPAHNPQYQDDGQGGQTLVSYDVDYYLIDPTDNNPTETGGPAKNDRLVGSSANDRITGYAGDDLITAPQGGNDVIDAGAGRDKIDAGAGNDVLIGGADGDLLNGGAGADTLIGGASRDVLAGGGGGDLLIGGAGDDDILGDAEYAASSFAWSVTNQGDLRVYDPSAGPLAPADGAADVIYAGEGNDYVWAGAGNDVVFGEGGEDRLNGNEGNDILLGGAGDDLLEAGNSGQSTLIGGTGQDTVRLHGAGNTITYAVGDGTDVVETAGGVSGTVLRLSGVSAAGLNLGLGQEGEVVLKVGIDATAQSPSKWIERRSRRWRDGGPGPGAANNTTWKRHA